jgi:HK97 family phage prohead protease
MLTGATERRDFSADLEIRSAGDGKLTLTGYASTSETPYEVRDFTETISRGAFKRTLGESPDVVLLREHEGLPLARTTSGTLTLSEDARGLRVEAILEPSDPDVRTVLPKLERRDLTEMSLAFRAIKQAWNEDRTERTIRELSIHRGDVLLVARGANASTTVSVRSADRAKLSRRAQRYLDAEMRWAAYLRRKGVRSHDSGRDFLELVKAKRARLSRSTAYVHSSDATPLGRYSADEVTKLGEREPPLALKRPNGTYGYPLTDYADLSNALAAYKNPEFDNYDGLVRSWIVKRAILLGLVDKLPKAWTEAKNPKLHPNGLAPSGPVGQALPSGPVGAGSGTAGSMSGSGAV